MSCTKFLARYSEFLDGYLAPSDFAACEEHLRECSSCRRYHRVLGRALGILRSLPEVVPSHDFLGRLKHRMYNERLRPTRTSAISGATLFSMAAIVIVLAWSPTLWKQMRTDSTVQHGESADADLGMAVSAEPSRQPSGMATRVSRQQDPNALPAALWGDTNHLLYRFSPVARRYQADPVSELNTAVDH